MNEVLLNKINEAARSINSTGVCFEDTYSNSELFHLYVAVFGVMPNFFELGEKTYAEQPAFIGEGKEEEDTLPVDADKTLPKILDVLGDTCVALNHFNRPFIISESGLMIYTTYHGVMVCLYKENKLPEAILNCVVYREPKKKQMLYVTQSSRGFSVTRMEVNKQECDISTNYNDDLPDDKIRESLSSDESGIIILHGIPGCGKTSYIRNLIYSIDKKFIFLDSSCFHSITDASFIDLLVSNRNSIFVLEDCETLLQDRSSGNTQLAALLNLSDGILGDSLSLKFLCTFNSDLSKIDPAILRKGRLKIKYEFGKLKANKVQKLASKLGKEIPDGKDLPLCDVYSYGTENNGEQKTRPRVGF